MTGHFTNLVVFSVFVSAVFTFIAKYERVLDAPSLTARSSTEQIVPALTNPRSTRLLPFGSTQTEGWLKAD